MPLGIYIRLSTIMCSAVLVGAGTTAAPAEADSNERVTTPPALPVVYALPAVDHFITYSSSRGLGPKGGSRITVWRAGSHVREIVQLQGARGTGPAVTTTSYWNLATGGHAREFVNANGSSQFHFSRGSGWHYRLRRTDEIRTIAGQRCRIWRTEAFDDNWAQDPNRLSCVTEDGLLLHEALVDGGGKVYEERTALTIERRKVSSEEVLPPREALDWAAWQRQVKQLKHGDTGRPDNYELRLKREKSYYERADIVLYRASAGWLSTESRLNGELQSFQLRHASGALGINSYPSNLILFRKEPNLLPGSGKPLDRESSKVLGEVCHWFDATSPSELHSFRHECRADDGLPLIVAAGGDDEGDPKLIAETVSRGRTPLHRVMLPPGTLSWARWGWPELEPTPKSQRGRARPNPPPAP